jgi:hypothetical protein
MVMGRAGQLCARAVAKHADATAAPPNLSNVLRASFNGASLTPEGYRSSQASQRRGRRADFISLDPPCEAAKLSP